MDSTKVNDTGTFTESIIGQIIARILLVPVFSFFTWLFTPFRWYSQNRHLRLLVIGRTFIFTFNPVGPKQKVMTFLEDGRIGEGRNNNESSWRLSRGCLEIFGVDNQIYSRFRFDKESGQLVHTNDAVTRSIRGQYFTVMGQRVERF
jgi:hypothetical protein